MDSAGSNWERIERAARPASPPACAPAPASSAARSNWERIETQGSARRGELPPAFGGNWERIETVATARRPEGQEPVRGNWERIETLGDRQPPPGLTGEREATGKELKDAFYSALRRAYRKQQPGKN